VIFADDSPRVRWLKIVVSTAVALFWLVFLLFFGPWIGAMIVILVGMTGLSDTRIGTEIVWTVGNTIGMVGGNSSGRPGDDPFLDWRNFPFLTISITVGMIYAIRSWIKRKR
jgi:hypothetical protein